MDKNAFTAFALSEKLSNKVAGYNLSEENGLYPYIFEGCVMTDLHQMKCVACRASEPTVTDEEISALLPQIPDWQVKEVEGVKRLERVFKFKNFVEALEFTNKIGAIAEEENHHPLITTEYGRTTVDWWTHKIKGLHKNDFILAARTDRLL